MVVADNGAMSARLPFEARWPGARPLAADPVTCDAAWRAYLALSWNGSSAAKSVALAAVPALTDPRQVQALVREYRSLSWSGSPRTVEIKQILLAAVGRLGREAGADQLLPEYTQLAWGGRDQGALKRRMLVALSMTGTPRVQRALNAEYQKLGWEEGDRKRLLFETLKATRAV